MNTNRINSLIIASIALTLGTVALTYFDIQKNREANHWIIHTYEVINESSEFLSYVKDSETGQRGYLITGDSAYLQPYLHARQDQESHLNRLLELTRDNPQQQRLLTVKIRPLVEVKNEKVKEGIWVYDHEGRDRAFAVIRNNSGKEAMDSLRFYMKILTEREYVLLGTRNQYLKTFYRVVDVTRYASLLIILLISTLAFIALFQKQKQNRSLIERLERFNDHLEDTVTKRTQELNEKNQLTLTLNEELQQSMEEIKAFSEALQIQNIKTEDALEEVRDLYNFSPCGYHSLDSEGVFIRINATELEWLGYTRDELLGKKKLKDILSAESAGPWQKMYEEYKIKGNIFNAELELTRKNGSTLPVLLNSSALYDANGNFIMSRSTIFDLTERKEIERQLKEANKALIKVNEDKNNFLGMASHDLKSPLNSILGLISLLKMDSANLTPDQRENLNLVSGASLQMKAMIDKLLDLNRIEQGRTLVQKMKVDLVSLIQTQLAGFQPQAARKSIQLLFDYHPPALSLESDGSILQQILENLISNALKFSTPNKNVWVTATPKQEVVIMEVRDEGPGIRPEEFHRLFGKFQKLSARPTGGESSSGLGLSIVKELVEVLGGKISCQSAIGVGTVFIVELPLDG